MVWLCSGRGGYVTGVWCARVHEISARVCGKCQGVCGICTHVAEVDICCVSERAFTVGVVPTHVLGGHHRYGLCTRVWQGLEYTSVCAHAFVDGGCISGWMELVCVCLCVPACVCVCVSLHVCAPERNPCHLCGCLLCVHTLVFVGATQVCSRACICYVSVCMCVCRRW